MPRAAARGGARPLSWTREFRLLPVAVRVSGDDADVRRELEFVAQDAVQPGAPERTVTFTVRRGGDGFAIEQDGRALDEERHAVGVMDAIFRAAHQAAFAALGPVLVLRGAVGTVGTTRVLAVGEARSGLTALAIRLLQRGAAMEGDALCVVRDGEVTAFPRAFQLRNGIERALPDLAAGLGDLPRLEGQAGARIWAWRPDRAGFSWEIRREPVAAVLVVEAGHGGETRLVDLPRYRAAQHLVQSVLSSPSGSGAISALARLADGATCRRLVLGDAERGALEVFGTLL